MTPPVYLSDRALGRALLARQGLLQRFDAPLVDVVEAIGAMQGQAWAALPVGLWTRMASFAPADLYAALERDELRWGIGIRGTLHLVSAREHPAYAVVATQPTRSWHRAIAATTPAMDELRGALLTFAAGQARTNEEIGDFAEAWIAERPGAIDPREVEAQRTVKWRPIYRWSQLTRIPKGGAWGAKAPADHTAPADPPRRGQAADPGQRPTHGQVLSPAPERAPLPPREQALEQVTRRHLRAFGPAAAEDVAGWIGARTPPIRDLLEGTHGLARFEDQHGHALYDLPDAPRPDPGTPAPPRLLGAFDSTLLAYGAKRRQRILPEALRDLVYQKANLQIRPTFLVDGLVAGTWSIDVRRREATLALRPARALSGPDLIALSDEARGLLKALHPGAKSHQVVGA